VSPSLLSQIENGKSQPSVATLYALAQVLQISIDNLFEVRDGVGPTIETTAESGVSAGDNVVPLGADPSGSSGGLDEHDEATVRRTDLGSLHQVWQGGGSTDRVSVTMPNERTRLVMDTGVIWEQLATNTGHQLDFMEITYPPGSSSTSDERMLQHDGFEYGYMLEGELEITLGFEVFTLRAGEAVGLNSAVPHLLRNRGTVPARGIWFVHHRHN
jgi:quercetin dioxygenase-like cupin family protein/DNA-binding XRE family transcriptional regulator